MSQLREIAALAEIARHFPGATLYCYLKPGERFHKVGHDMVYVKGTGGWCRSELTGRSWRPGRHTGVVRV